MWMLTSGSAGRATVVAVVAVVVVVVVVVLAGLGWIRRSALPVRFIMSSIQES
jgi:fumarate reductase subunit D